MTESMPNAYSIPSSNEIMTKLKEYIASNPQLHEKPYPISNLIGWCMSQYGGKLNPIKLRSMIIVAFYDKDAVKFILSNARNDILALNEFVSDSEERNRIEWSSAKLDSWINNF